MVGLLGKGLKPTRDLGDKERVEEVDGEVTDTLTDALQTVRGLDIFFPLLKVLKLQTAPFFDPAELAFLTQKRGTLKKVVTIFLNSGNMNFVYDYEDYWREFHV